MTALFRVFRECKALAAVTDPDIASWGSVEMTDCADLDFRKDARAAGGRNERRWKMVRGFMMAAVASMVVLALIAEARMTPEQRTVLFESLSYSYP